MFNNEPRSSKRRTLDRRAARRFKAAQLVALIAWGDDTAAAYFGAAR